MKLTKAKFKDIRDNAYKMAGELGTLAEIGDCWGSGQAYNKSCDMLDAIDEIGYRLGYLDAETNEEL